MVKDLPDPVCPYAKIVELYLQKTQPYRKSYLPNSSIITVYRTPVRNLNTIASRILRS
jgi:hypothetical protein